MLEARAIGRLVADPTMRKVKKDGKTYEICDLRLACRQSKEHTDFINVTAWGGPGDFLFNNVHKGQKIFIGGRLKVPPYDKEKKREYEPYIVMETFEFCDGKKGQETGATSGSDFDDTLDDSDLAEGDEDK